MIDAWHLALGRALSASREAAGAAQVGVLLGKMVEELRHTVSQQATDLAILIRRGDGRTALGRLSYEAAISDDTLLGVLLESELGELGYRVKDHALEPSRLLRGAHRSSVAVGLALPEAITQGGVAMLWMAYACVAAPIHVEQARSLGQVISTWFSAYGPLLEVIEGLRERVEEVSTQLEEASSVAHDARAPLGIMRRMISEIGGGPGERVQELQVVLDQFDYLEELLARCSPRELCNRGTSSDRVDLHTAIHRVVQRLGTKGSNLIVVEVPRGMSVSGVSSSDVERIFSNVLGNALRYGGDSAVTVRSDVSLDGRLVECTVRDGGPGFSDQLLQQFEAQRARSALPSSQGWGIGLISSRKRVERCGGMFSLVRDEGGGGVVRISLPRAQSERQGMECDGTPFASQKSETESELVVVDDDFEHARSLVKLLGAQGIKGRACRTVADAIEFVQAPDVSILCDAQMPGGGAERLLVELRQLKLARRVAVMSGDMNDELLYRLAAKGAESFFLKPVETNELREWCRRATPL